MTQTCGRCCRCGRSWCRAWGLRWRHRGGSLLVGDAGGRALSSIASLASLVRPEQHVEGAPVYSHVWRVVLTEPGICFKNKEKFPRIIIGTIVAVGAFGIFLWFPPSKHDTFIFMLLEESLKHHSLLLSDLHEVAAFVAVGVLGGQSECRAGEVQLAFALLSALRDSIFSKFGNIYLLETCTNFDTFRFCPHNLIFAKSIHDHHALTLNLTTHLTFLPYVSVSWVEKSTDSPTPRVIVSLDLPEGQV